MKVKYCEIFVKHNIEDLWTNATLWFGYDEETIISKDTTIVVQFDDEDIHDISNTSNNLDVSWKGIAPPRFTIKRDDKHTMYFKVEPYTKKNGQKTLDILNIFEKYKKYNRDNTCASDFTCLYCTYKQHDDVDKKKLAFSLIRIQSSISTPRYQMAYNSLEFNKDEIMGLINCIFKN